VISAIVLTRGAVPLEVWMRGQIVVKVIPQ
jgi:hypothetical protein